MVQNSEAVLTKN